MPVDADFIKWFIEAYGIPAFLAAYIFYKHIGLSDTKPDVARELITKIDGVHEAVYDLRERVAKIEGKIDARS